LFESFLENLNATTVEALYILGDLFDVWIGDDATAKGYQNLMLALHDTVHRSIPIYLMHGNRDFLLGQQFAQISACQLIPDPTVINLYGTPTLLMHGDTLCTDDHAYQTFRTQVRSVEWQRKFLSMSQDDRNNAARHLREESRRQSQSKEDYLMDVNEQSVRQALKHHGVTHMIHGHTHRQAIHSVALEQGVGKRFVLGDWHRTGTVLVCHEQDWHFEVVQPITGD
jgi:UDP-2,3-diacylglucosamine hydrolase